MALGALLHDIGKVRVDASILQYPGRLDPHQWAEIKLHPQEGAAAILAAADPGQEVAAVVALEHHARFDGAGYPGGERRDQHLFSRVVTVVDVYDALTTRRSYRRAESPHLAMNVLINGSGSHFDPDIVQTLVDLVGVFPPGSMLRLADGRVALITRKGEGEFPEAVLVADAGGELLAMPEPVELGAEPVVTEVMSDAVGFDPASVLEVLLTSGDG